MNKYIKYILDSQKNSAQSLQSAPLAHNTQPIDTQSFIAAKDAAISAGISFGKQGAENMVDIGEIAYSAGIPNADKVVKYGQGLSDTWESYKKGKNTWVNKFVEKATSLSGLTAIAATGGTATALPFTYASTEAINSAVGPKKTSNAINRISKNIGSKQDLNTAESFYKGYAPQAKLVDAKKIGETALGSWHSLFTSGANRYGAAGIVSDAIAGVSQTSLQRETDLLNGKEKRPWVSRSTLRNYGESALGGLTKIVNLPGAADVGVGYAGEVLSNISPQAPSVFIGYEEANKSLETIRDKRKKLFGP